MTIVIVTVYNSYNCGSYLQAYALYKTLKEKGLTTYKLINTYGLSSSLIDRLKHNKPITTVTVNDLCRILDCGVEGIIEYQRDRDE